MAFFTYWKFLLVFGPVAVLLALGLLVALKSGVETVRTHQGFERLMGNLSQLVLRLAGYGIGIAALNRVIGSPFELGF